MQSPFVTVKVPRVAVMSAGSALVVWFITLPAVIRSGSVLIGALHLVAIVLACQGLMWAATEGHTRRARYIIAVSILGSAVLQLRLW